ncbi:MAG: L,D-transpeptidase [Bacteroidales bacterium]|nr:L,D-transpeptidase [Bacteroidales bacterium]
MKENKGKRVRIFLLLLVCVFSFGETGAVKIEKELLYDQHTLDDHYMYGKVSRQFQWEKISNLLDTLATIQKEKKGKWGILVNYRNANGKAPAAKEVKIDEYKGISDMYGVERTQSVPLYNPNDSTIPERYGRDGTLVILLSDSSDFTRVKVATCPGEWLVPGRYIKPIDSTSFEKAIFVDRTNQNIATLEKSGNVWFVRSMNPATTGVHRPPHMRPTPTGIFVLQMKKPKMFYTKDGSSQIAGFAPYASRFSNGGYLHGVPVNDPTGKRLIEFSQTLGSTPRSHMCVRNATSHALFIYNWAPAEGALVFVFD